MKKILFTAACVVAAFSLVCSCGGRKTSSQTETEAQVAADSALVESADSVQSAPIADEPLFDIITNYGTIRIKLYSGTPLHRDNFVKLATSGFYNGLLFHRVINGFMIQGGDPLTKDEANADAFGTGGPDYTIPAEIKPEYTHKKGALAAARRGDAANPMRESSGSQFYLVQDEAACAQLDGQYTVFGETVQGLDVIDSIAAVETTRRDRPVSNVIIMNVKLVQE